MWERKAEIMNKESTYILLARSEDKGRSLIEVGVFGLIALSALLAVWQFAQEATALPLTKVQSVTEQRQVVRIAS